MKALVLEGVNQPLQFKDVADPAAGPGEVVVKIGAAALNHRDLWIQKGQYAGLKFPIILGSDGCGTVESCGEGVDDVVAGARGHHQSRAWTGARRKEAQADEFRILGLPDDGTFAERVRRPREPAGRQARPSDAPARCRAAAGRTDGLPRVVFACRTARRASGCSSRASAAAAALFALQYAVAAGAKVFVTSGSDAKIARAVELGAAGGVNYKTDDWAKRSRSRPAAAST